MPNIDTRMLLPKGIQLSKSGNSFRVQTRKNVIRDQKKVTLKDFVAVKINYQPNMTAADKLKTFNVALEDSFLHTQQTFCQECLRHIYLPPDLLHILSSF